MARARSKSSQLRALTDDLQLVSTPKSRIDEETSNVDFPPPEFEDQTDLSISAYASLPPSSPMDDATGEISQMSSPPKPVPSSAMDEITALDPPRPRKQLEASRKIVTGQPVTRPDSRRSKPRRTKGGKTDLTRTVLGLITGAFGELPIPVLKEVYHEMIPIDFEAGELIFAKGEDAGPLYVLVRGALEEEVSSHLKRRAQSGTVLGLEACVSGEPRSTTVRAEARSEVLALPPARLQLLCDKHEAFRRAIQRMRSER